MNQFKIIAIALLINISTTLCMEKTTIIKDRNQKILKHWQDNDKIGHALVQLAASNMKKKNILFKNKGSALGLFNYKKQEVTNYLDNGEIIIIDYDEFCDLLEPRQDNELCLGAYIGKNAKTYNAREKSIGSSDFPL